MTDGSVDYYDTDWETVENGALEAVSYTHLVPTEMGETLSWPYLCWVREHPLHWKVPTQVLYADTDPLTRCV